MNKPVRIAVTGAAGNIGYALNFRLAAGNLLGPDQPVLLHLIEIPAALGSIFQGAFNPKAVTGGAVGSVIIVMQKGIARGIFSNEAGLGSAPEDWRERASTSTR